MAETRRLLHALCRAGARVPAGAEAIAAVDLQAVCSMLDPAVEEADAELLAAEAGRHHAIVRDLFDAGPVLPIRFGTVVDTTDIPSLLEDNVKDIRAELDRLSGVAEWGVRIIADADTLARAAECSSEDIRAIDEELARSTPGRAYLLKRKREAALAEAAERHSSAVTDHVREQLTTASVEQAILPPPSVIPAGGELLANLAFLVADDRSEEFAAAGDRVAAAQGIELQLSGPWPPYSFVRLSLGRGAQ